MVYKDKIISIFCLIDDILRGIPHKKDIRGQEYGNHSSAIQFMKQYGSVPKLLGKSRFNRRLRKAGKLLYEIFEIVSSFLRTSIVKCNI